MSGVGSYTYPKNDKYLRVRYDGHWEVSNRCGHGVLYYQHAGRYKVCKYITAFLFFLVFSLSLSLSLSLLSLWYLSLSLSLSVSLSVSLSLSLGLSSVSLSLSLSCMCFCCSLIHRCIHILVGCGIGFLARQHVPRERRVNFRLQGCVCGTISTQSICERKTLIRRTQWNVHRRISEQQTTRVRQILSGGWWNIWGLMGTGQEMWQRYAQICVWSRVLGHFLQ